MVNGTKQLLEKANKSTTILNNIGQLEREIKQLESSPEFLPPTEYEKLLVSIEQAKQIVGQHQRSSNEIIRLKREENYIGVEEIKQRKANLAVMNHLLTKIQNGRKRPAQNPVRILTYF